MISVDVPPRQELLGRPKRARASEKKSQSESKTDDHAVKENRPATNQPPPPVLVSDDSDDALIRAGLQTTDHKKPDPSDSVVAVQSGCEPEHFGGAGDYEGTEADPKPSKSRSLNNTRGNGKRAVPPSATMVNSSDPEILIEAGDGNIAPTMAESSASQPTEPVVVPTEKELSPPLPVNQVLFGCDLNPFRDL